MLSSQRNVISWLVILLFATSTLVATYHHHYHSIGSGRFGSPSGISEQQSNRVINTECGLCLLATSHILSLPSENNSATAPSESRIVPSTHIGSLLSSRFENANPRAPPFS